MALTVTRLTPDRRASSLWRPRAAADALTEEQLGQLGVTREALRRLAAGEVEFPSNRQASWNTPAEEQTPPPKIL